MLKASTNVILIPYFTKTLIQISFPFCIVCDSHFQCIKSIPFSKSAKGKSHFHSVTPSIPSRLKVLEVQTRLNQHVLLRYWLRANTSHFVQIVQINFLRLGFLSSLARFLIVNRCLCQRICRFCRNVTRPRLRK